MLFNSPQFALFFLLFLAGYRLLPARLRPDWMLAGSLVFYSLWYPAYLLLLLGDLAVNWLLLRGIATAARRGRWLVAAVTWNLGLLAWFKYADFLLGTLEALVPWSAGELHPAFDLILPLGISFYSFQILALAIDVYRGDAQVPASLRRYALFISFFPQLIAGPILRGSEFLPQLERGGATSLERDRRGLFLIAGGLAKKVVFGDFLLGPYVTEVFAHPDLASSPVLLVAAWSFAFQIYFDFAGYTDMARGMALLLGFELPRNFTEPYLSRNPAEFWRRWHMTLSRWLRDYLYIPLGGNRSGEPAMYRNLFLTMLLGGLWHGAGWNFLVWGGGHGLLLAGHRALCGRSDGSDRPLQARDAPAVFAMFNAAALLFVVFRVTDPALGLAFFRGLAALRDPAAWPLVPTAIVGLCALSHVLERRLRRHAGALRSALGSGARAALLEGAAIGAIFALATLAGGTGAEFIYFQF